MFYRRSILYHIMGRFSFLRFLSDQWLAVPELEKQDLSSQTVLVVGANVGLGLEAAKHFARMEPGKLILACRSLKKAEDAAKGSFYIQVRLNPRP